VEKGEAGHGATWAAAGMLAPHAEAEPGEECLLELLLASHAAWAGFAHELELASDMAVDYRTEGTLMVALDHDDAERLKFHYELQCRSGLEVQQLSGYEARQMEPHLSRTVTTALFCPRDYQVDNRKTALALRTAFLRAGGLLREHSEVDEIIIAADRVLGVRLGDETLVADTVVLAAGAWSRNIRGLPEALRPPVRPVKGQMIAVQMPSNAALIEHVVWGPDVYLVPRSDGRILIGATVEEQGFDTQLTAGGLHYLLQGAWETLPGVYDLPIVEMWAGLRPGSRDDAPILGETSVRGLILATGHYRNGILLAPITAQAISQLVLTGAIMEEAKPFALARFKN
jgi:glycine oxidase